MSDETQQNPSEAPDPDLDLEARPLEDVHVPKETARRSLAEKLEANFSFAPGAAQALARAVVDPAAVRRALDAPLTQPIPDGDVTYIVAEMWTAAVAVNPNNPRRNERNTYPVAARDGRSTVRTPLAMEPAGDGSPMLVYRGDDPQHVAGEIEDAAQFVRTFNPDLGEEIATERVLEPITAIMAEFRHRDGSAPAYAPVAVDGSTRTAHCQVLVGSSATDAVYKHPRSGPREWNDFISRRANAQDLPTSQITEKAAAAHRALRYHARILLGVQPVRTRQTISVVDAVRSIVAGIHVSPPKPWPAGSQIDEIADAVLDRLEEDGRIERPYRQYLAGLVAPADVGGERAYADIRALHIARVIFDPQHARAVSAAYRIVRDKQKLGRHDKPEIAAELMMRAFRSDYPATEVRSIRSILQRTITSDYRRLPRRGPERTPDELLAAALAEFEAAPADVGPERLELGIRAAYWLVQQRALRRDTRESKQLFDDSRAGSAVLRALLVSRHGLLQLHRAIVDGRAAPPAVKSPTIRKVDETGALLDRGGGGFQTVDDNYLRETWPAQRAAGTERQAGVDEPDPTVLTDRQRLERLVGRARAAAETVQSLLAEMAQITQNGVALVQTEGIPWGTAEAMARMLREDADRLTLWAALNRMSSQAGLAPEDDLDDGDLFEPEAP
ncbi:hypothetical protein [Longimicrobium sp.]|uniref:hypothetical protein n=1 Tax=Longimicrobium sp. TaxID=2029185 RepID=UPI002E33CC37|nr:hypothetical protein [Longimicrobium sp.]HEX6036418.1 hypothetical protein [Longimicrobium sp.]